MAARHPPMSVSKSSIGGSGFNASHANVRLGVASRKDVFRYAAVMQRFLAIVIACFVVFATSGAHRALASWVDAPQPASIMSMDQAVEKSKAPCCKTYRVDNDHQTSACNLPLVMLPEPIEVVSRRTVEDSWSIRAGPPLVGVLSGPGEQPPKHI